jgi:hypothetical protein
VADQEQARNRLAELGVKYKKALGESDRLRDLVKAAAAEADAAGISRLEIIRLSQMSRTAAYGLFRETKGVKKMIEVET